MELTKFTAGIQAQLGKSYLLPYSKPQTPWQDAFKQGWRQKETTPISTAKFCYLSEIVYFSSKRGIHECKGLQESVAIIFLGLCIRRQGETPCFCSQDMYKDIKWGPSSFISTGFMCFSSAWDAALPQCQRPQLPPHALSASSAAGRCLQNRS